MNKKRWIAVIFALGAIAAHSWADIIWPPDLEWNALMQGTSFYYDAIGDSNPGAIDLVGTTDTYSAGYWALVEDGYDDGVSTSDAFMLRLRLSDDGSSRKFAWQVSLDTDGDASNVEWILQLVQSGPKSGQGVELIQTADGGPTIGDVDIGSNTSAWMGDENIYSRWTAVPASSDYYVDIAVPWDTFTSVTGVTELDQLRAVLSSSPSHGKINGDVPLGAGLTDQISNVLSETIPEPAVASLLLGSGFGILFYRRVFNRYDPENECPG